MHIAVILIVVWIILNLALLGAVAAADRWGHRQMTYHRIAHSAPQQRIIYNVARRRVGVGFSSTNACRLIRSKAVRISVINWSSTGN